MPWCSMRARPYHTVQRPSHSRTKALLPSRRQQSRIGNHQVSTKAFHRPKRPLRIISCNRCPLKRPLAWNTAHCSISRPILLLAPQGRRSIEDRSPSSGIVRSFRATRSVNEYTTIPIPWHLIRYREPGRAERLISLHLLRLFIFPILNYLLL